MSRETAEPEGAPPAATDRARLTGAALESHYCFLLWLLPAVDKFPRTRKFTLGDRLQTTALDFDDSSMKVTFYG